MKMAGAFAPPILSFSSRRKRENAPRPVEERKRSITLRGTGDEGTRKSCFRLLRKSSARGVVLAGVWSSSNGLFPLPLAWKSNRSGFRFSGALFIGKQDRRGRRPRRPGLPKTPDRRRLPQNSGPSKASPGTSGLPAAYPLLFAPPGLPRRHEESPNQYQQKHKKRDIKTRVLQAAPYSAQAVVIAAILRSANQTGHCPQKSQKRQPQSEHKPLHRSHPRFSIIEYPAPSPCRSN